MNHNYAAKVPLPAGKRKADVDTTCDRSSAMNPCTPSASEVNSLKGAKNAKFETSTKAPSTANCKRGKQFHSGSLPLETTDSTLIKSPKGKISENRTRLQLLQDHNIIHNVILFLDETDLFHLENSYSDMIGQFAIARHWSYLSTKDEDKIIYAHKSWRPMNEKDMRAVADGVRPTEIEIFVPNDKDDGDGDNDANCETTMGGYPCEKHLLARHIGRNFAREAIFVREREKEACCLYDFDRTPTNENDIPIFTDIYPLNESSSSTLLLSSHISIDREKHWCEWYDYRAESVNEKYAFVRLSLRDGSRRFWHGFRRLTTNYNTTFFRLHFDMKELIKDMQWAELELYLKLNDTTHPFTQNRPKAIEPLIRMIQLTISLEGKLLVATGGYSPSFSGLAGNDKCYLHARHYRYPLADTTKNDLEWMPYRVCLEANSTQNELVIQFACDHANLPFMRAGDIGNPNANAHW